MSIYVGTQNIKPSGVSKVYVGNQLVYEDSPTPSVDYLCFTANSGGSTIALKRSSTSAPSVTVYYSADKTNWSQLVVDGSAVVLARTGDKVYLKGTNSAFSDATEYNQFVMTGSISASGDVTTLLEESGNVLDLTTKDDYTFQYLFYECSVLTTAPKLPSTTLTLGCYTYMFSLCTSLVTAPALPATTLAGRCYMRMFMNCPALNTIPALPTAARALYCYHSMFYGCQNIMMSETYDATSYPYTFTLGINPLPTSDYVWRMFTGTGGSFAGAPTAQTLYTSNTIIS